MAAAAKKVGLDLPAAYGHSCSAIQSSERPPWSSLHCWRSTLPPKALVWEDDQGKVLLSYNSSDYLYNTIYRGTVRRAPPSTAPFAKLLDEISDQATK